MSIAEFLRSGWNPTWHQGAENFLSDLIEARFGKTGLAGVSLRCPGFSKPEDVAFAAILHKDSPTSGGYGGTSLVVFPSESGPSLVALGVGTQGLSPDESILTRPGHARFGRALAAWLRTLPSISTAWAKVDPTRTDVSIPKDVAACFVSHAKVFKKYGDVLYVIFEPNEPSGADINEAFTAMLDFYMLERGFSPLAPHRSNAVGLRRQYEGLILENASIAETEALLLERRFVILQGPPGTGKTRLALSLIRDKFSGHGSVVQFHPSTSYEQFVGGLAPIESDGQFGFAPRAGHLLQAAMAAEIGETPYLLVIDEINRADLARTLGEAIYLFEPNDVDRSVELTYDFGLPNGRNFKLPSNLFILGTMNSADRSIALLDLAIRRRFAFLNVWPDGRALEQTEAVARSAFEQLTRIFMAHATDEQLKLLPGHAYFFSTSPTETQRRLRYEVVPLLRDYIDQGLVAGFREEIEGFLQSLESK